VLEYLLAAAYGASAGLFALLAVALAGAYRRLGLEELAGAAWGFALLALSSALGAAELLAPTPRAAVSLYTGSSSTAAAGLFVLVYSRLASSAGRLPALAPLALVGSLDALAAALGVAAALGSRGLARLGFALLALGHAFRVAAAALLPGGAGAGALLAGEALRAAAALAMASYYTGGVLGGGGEAVEG